MKADCYFTRFDLPVEAKGSIRPAGAHLGDPRLDDTLRFADPFAACQMQVVYKRLAPHGVEGPKAVTQAELLLIKDAPRDLDQSHQSLPQCRSIAFTCRASLEGFIRRKAALSLATATPAAHGPVRAGLPELLPLNTAPSSCQARFRVWGFSA
jgi:hypothetical protein